MLSSACGGSDRCGAGTLSTVNDDSCATGTVAVSVPVTPPAGPVPLPVAVLTTEPASRSDCARVYDPLQLIDSPGAKVTGGGGSHASAGSNGSVTVTPVSV